MDELKRQIQDLEQKNQELQKKFDEFYNTFEEFKRIQTHHMHGGNDGSEQLYNNTISLKSGIGISSGKFQFIDAETPVSDTDSRISTIIGGLVLGDGSKGSGTSNSAQNTTQFLIEHHPLSNGITNDTFIQAYRSPFYAGKNGNISSGGTTLSQNEYNWTTNELDGAYVLVVDSANPTQFDVYEIASNTSSTITITGGTWTFTNSSALFTVFMPVYLGSANYPYRRIYTDDGIGGGIRFGVGDTNGGQNALLYTDGASLKFRKKDGTVTTVTVV
jgi:hypothetical protein